MATLRGYVRAVAQAKVGTHFGLIGPDKAARAQALLKGKRYIFPLLNGGVSFRIFKFTSH